MSHVRYDQGSKIGDPGVVYEFEIKLQKITGVDCTQEELDYEAEESLENFKWYLKHRYKWITEIYQTGRSGGWLAVKDGKGGARLGTLKTIIGLIEAAQETFVKNLRYRYPAR